MTPAPEPPNAVEEFSPFEPTTEMYMLVNRSLYPDGIENVKVVAVDDDTDNGSTRPSMSAVPAVEGLYVGPSIVSRDVGKMSSPTTAAPDAEAMAAGNATVLRPAPAAAPRT